VKTWTLRSLLVTILLSVLGWAIIAAACLLVGSSGMGWENVEQFWARREPVLLASLVGAGLAASGVAYQAILRNPLADPYLLGVSSGASLWAYVWRVLPAGALTGAALAGSQQVFAFIGAGVSVGVAFLLASRRGRLEPITLLLVGVIVNAINGSIFLFLNAVRRGLADTGSEFTFLVGGMQTSLQQSQIITTGVCVGVGWVVLLMVSHQLNIVTLTPAEAQSLGIRVQRLRWMTLIVASIVTASVVAISGPIGFIGLVCPHLARRIVGTDHRKLLPVATAIGASLLALADACSRLLSATTMLGTLLPVGVLTGLIGGPFFLLLLWQHRRQINGEDA